MFGVRYCSRTRFANTVRLCSFCSFAVLARSGAVFANRLFANTFVRVRWLEQLQIAWYPPCPSDHIASPDRGGAAPLAARVALLGRGAEPPGCPRAPCGEGVRTSLGHAKCGRYALFSAENVLFCEVLEARPYLGGGSAPPTTRVALQLVAGI